METGIFPRVRASQNALAASLIELPQIVRTAPKSPHAGNWTYPVTEDLKRQLNVADQALAMIHGSGVLQTIPLAQRINTDIGQQSRPAKR